MKSRTLALILLVLAIVPQALRADSSTHRVVVYLKPGSTVADLGQTLPEGLSVLAVQDEMVILVSRARVQSVDLETLKKNPHIESARLDFTIKKREDAVKCETPPAEEPQVTKLTKVASKLNGCDLEGLCPNMGLEKLWAQTQVDADLMKEYIDAHKLRSSKIKTSVAVVDSGFDPDQTRNMAQGGSLKVLPGVFGKRKGLRPDRWNDEVDKTNSGAGDSLVGELDRDKDGHGTMVASVIGAKNGIGVAPNAELTVYRVTIDDSGSASDAYAEYAIRNACNRAKKDDANSTPVINLSMGGRSDEMAKKRDETENKPLIDFLQKSGCILVKAAGNDSFIKADSAVNGERLDDPMLRVAATSTLSGRAGFSSTGEIQAPGEKVYALISKDMEYPPNAEKLCEKVADDAKPAHPSAAFVNGTSFASPIAAGILSETIGVLRSKPEFDQMAPKDRIALANRILAASKFAGTINGLRAVRLAELWINGQVSRLPTVQELAQKLESSPAAECGTYKKVGPCKLKSTCEGKRECWKGLRRELASCPKNEALADAALEQSLQGDLLESASKYLRARKTSRNDAKVAASSARILNARLKRASNGIDNESIAELFPDYLDTLDKRKPAQIERAVNILYGYLDSYEFKGAMNSGPDRGSDEQLASLLVSFDKLKKLVGPTKFDAFLKNIFDKLLESSSSYSLVTAVRLLNALQADVRFESARNLLRSYDEIVFGKISKVDGKAPKRDNADFVLFLEEPATGRYYDAFLDRMKEPLKRELASKDRAAVGQIKARYALEHLDGLIEDKSERTYFALHAMFSNAGMGGTASVAKEDAAESIKKLRSLQGGGPSVLHGKTLRFLENTMDPFVLLGASRLLSPPAFVLHDYVDAKKPYTPKAGTVVLGREPWSDGEVRVAYASESSVPFLTVSEDKRAIYLRRAYVLAKERYFKGEMTVSEFDEFLEELREDPKGSAPISGEAYNLSADPKNPKFSSSRIGSVNEILIETLDELREQLKQQVVFDYEYVKLLSTFAIFHSDQLKHSRAAIEAIKKAEPYLGEERKGAVKDWLSKLQ